MIQRPVLCAPRKIDWMLINRKEALRKIVVDNGTFVVFPPLGIHHNVITVRRTYKQRRSFGLFDEEYLLCCRFSAMIPFSCNEQFDRSWSWRWLFENANDTPLSGKTSDTLLSLQAQSYVACIQLSHVVLELLAASSLVQPVDDAQFHANLVQNAFGYIALESRAEIVLKNQFIEVYGSDAAVKSAVAQICELDFVKVSPVKLARNLFTLRQPFDSCFTPPLS